VAAVLNVASTVDEGAQSDTDGVVGSQVHRVPVVGVGEIQLARLALALGQQSRRHEQVLADKVLAAKEAFVL
jgi:hypothetical protein